MKRKAIYKAIIAFAVAMAFVMPVAAFANVGTIGVTSDSENTSYIKNIIETTIDTSNIKNTINNVLEKSDDIILSTRGRGTIYVDDDAPPGWYNATQVHTIQEGVNNATAKDTVYVYNGTYYEHVMVNKRLNLVGESRENVIVDGSGTGNVFATAGNRVLIDTFTIRNGDTGILPGGFKTYPSVANCEIYGMSDRGISLNFFNQYSTIVNCSIHDNGGNGFHIQGLSDYADVINVTTYNNGGDGISNVGASFMNVVNCTAYNNTGYGINLHGQNDATIMNCTVYDNGYGIAIWRYERCKLRNNVINNNGRNFGIAAWTAADCDQDIDPSNTINGRPIYYLRGVSNFTLDETNNFAFLGLYECTNITAINSDVCGVVLGSTTNSTISNVDVHLSSGSSGIGIFESSGITIADCDAYDNMEDGIEVRKSSSNTITNCTIYDNFESGIRLDTSTDNTIINCELYNNNDEDYGFPSLPIAGIYISKSSDNNVTNCDVHNNGDYGVFLAVSPDNTFRDNVIYDNDKDFALKDLGVTTDYVQDIDPSNTIDGRHMYYLIGQSDIELTEANNFGFLGLISCTNITARNGDAHGVVIVDTTDSTITNVEAHTSFHGIYVQGSSNIALDDCDAYDTNKGNGIYLEGCSDCALTNCNAYDTKSHGFFLQNCNDIVLESCDSYGHVGSFELFSKYSNDCTFMNCTFHDGNIGVYIHTCNRFDFINCIAHDFTGTGFNLYKGLGHNVINTTVYNNSQGIGISNTVDTSNTVTNCKAYDNIVGIKIYNAGDNIITNCDVYNNAQHGIYLWKAKASDNQVYHNNVVNNNPNACDDGTTGVSNKWNDTYPSGGNYWDDYTGVDDYSGPDQDIPGSDGIGDTPYNITGGTNQDRYPLMTPWDETPPVITNVLATPAVQNTTTPVNITCAVTDNWGMVDTVTINITGPLGFTLEEQMNEGSYWYEDTYPSIGIYYYYIQANDTTGNIATSDTYSFIITDLDLPTSAVNPLPAWTNTVPFMVAATAYDDNGVANVTLYYRYSSNGTTWTEWTSYGTDEDWPWSWSFTGSNGHYEFYSIATDNYGNIENAPSIADTSAGIDVAEPPITICTLSGTMGGNNWYISNVLVTLSATDNVSGVESTWYKIDAGYWTFYSTPFTVSTEGEHTVQYYSFDAAGNLENTNSISFQIDQNPPATEHEFDGVIGDEGWFVDDVEVTLSASDAASGVNYTMYKLNEGTWTTYTESFVVTEDGEHTLYYYSVDLAGNVEPTNEADFKIEHDIEPPVTTHEFDGIMGDNNWYTSNVVVVLSAEDDSAGVDYTMYKLEDDTEWQEYTGPILVTEDGEHTIMYFSVDKVGNEETVKGPFDFNIDQTVPTIELTWDDENSKLVADADDATSGVAKVEFYVNGEFVGEVTEAPYEWEVSNPQNGDMGQAIVFDNAGNNVISPEINNAVSQSQYQRSSSTPVPLQILSWLLGLK